MTHSHPKPKTTNPPDRQSGETRPTPSPLWASLTVAFRARWRPADRLSFLGLGALLVLALSACDLFDLYVDILVPGPCTDHTTHEVPDGPGILRGTWTGAVEDYPSRGLSAAATLTFVAAFVDATKYAVSGTFQLGDDPAMTLAGTVSGGCFQRYRRAPTTAAIETQTPLPPSTRLEAEVSDGSGTVVWFLWGDLDDFASDPSETKAFTLLQDGRYFSLVVTPLSHERHSP